VEELLPVALPHLPVVHFLPPRDEQAAVLQTTSEYLHQAGTQVASISLGFSQRSGETAALCDGLLELADDLDR
jgi:hypothetical protein